MGYCHERSTGRLVCDGCGRAPVGVQKIPCPFNYCPPPAFCAACRIDQAEAYARYHVKAGCGEHARRFEADVAAGKYPGLTRAG